VDVLLEIRGFLVEVLHDAQLLRRDIDRARREEPAQLQFVSLLGGESAPLVDHRVVQEVESLWMRMEVALIVHGLCPSLWVPIPSTRAEARHFDPIARGESGPSDRLVLSYAAWQP
jgi:hypothetical protein